VIVEIGIVIGSENETFREKLDRALDPDPELEGPGTCCIARI
jgi:hypothetical protein